MIPNDRLLSISDRNVSVLDAFKQADQVLLQGVSGITDLITTPGLINLDFADVKSVMANAGSALMGIGSARGEDRAVAAAEMAVSSPLLEASHRRRARRAALDRRRLRPRSVRDQRGGARWSPRPPHPEANIIFGATIDDALGDEVRVTVIAAGFDGGMPKRREDGNVRSGARRSQTQAETRAAAEQLAGTSDAPREARRDAEPEPALVGARAESAEQQPQSDSREPAPPRVPPAPSFDDDDLDVPDFLK